MYAPALSLAPPLAPAPPLLVSLSLLLLPLLLLLLLHLSPRFRNEFQKAVISGRKVGFAIRAGVGMQGGSDYSLMPDTVPYLEVRGT